MRFRLGLVFSLAALGACAPEIGDSCTTSIDCSINGDRICDDTVTDGYCTIIGCDPDTCPDRARCVEWRGAVDRTAVRYCMARCVVDDDCRENYRCLNPIRDREMFPVDEDIVDEAGLPVPLARVVDLSEGFAEARFCIHVGE